MRQLEVVTFPECRTFKLESDVNNRLSELGLDVDTLKQVAEAAQSAYGNKTENDPPFFPGTNAWAAAVRRLRECLHKAGWRKNSANYSLTISDQHKLKIVVASGDSRTGTDLTPTTKSGKGIMTELAILNNQRQADLFEELIPDEPEVDYSTWIFLFHVTDEVIRSELSLPFEINHKHVTRWQERIMLPDITNDPWEDEDETEDDSHVEVPVVRKKSN